MDSEGPGEGVGQMTVLTATVALSILEPVPKGTQYDLDELARLSGLTVRTIRYYIQQRLLHASGHRGPGASYDAGHLARLRLIRRLQADTTLPTSRKSGIVSKRGRPPRHGETTTVQAPDVQGQRSHWERISLASRRRAPRPPAAFTGRESRRRAPDRGGPADPGRGRRAASRRRACANRGPARAEPPQPR